MNLLKAGQFLPSELFNYSDYIFPLRICFPVYLILLGTSFSLTNLWKRNNFMCGEISESKDEIWKK